MSRAIQPGTLVLVRWADITQAATGGHEDADLTVWEQPGCWVGFRDLLVEDRYVTCVILAGARSTEGVDDAGWTAIPMAVVLDIVPLVPEPGSEQ